MYLSITTPPQLIMYLYTTTTTTPPPPPPFFFFLTMNQGQTGGSISLPFSLTWLQPF